MAVGTAYTKRYAGGFVDKPTLTTPIDQAFLNAVESALLQLIGSAPVSDGQVMQWDNTNTRYGPALLLNKNIDPAAAIASSKLDFTGANALTNAAIAGAAAIARSKLDFGAGLVNSDISAAAAIALSKLADPASGKVLTSKGAGAIADFPPGYELVRGSRTTPDLTTTGTNYATGGDLLAADINFTADGTSNYIVEAWGPMWFNSGANQMVANLKLDTADAGFMSMPTASGASSAQNFFARAYLLAPSAASHAVNVRIFSTSASTTTVRCGAGGAGTLLPIYLRVIKA